MLGPFESLHPPQLCRLCSHDHSWTRDGQVGYHENNCSRGLLDKGPELSSMFQGRASISGNDCLTNLQRQLPSHFQKISPSKLAFESLVRVLAHKPRMLGKSKSVFSLGKFFKKTNKGTGAEKAIRFPVVGITSDDFLSTLLEKKSIKRHEGLSLPLMASNSAWEKRGVGHIFAHLKMLCL